MMCKYIVYTLVLICFSGCSKDPSARAIEFAANVYAGKPMQSEEWFTREALSSKLFSTFGGIDALIKDSVAEATRNQGVQSIRVISIKQKDHLVLVEIEVVFNNKQTSNGIDAWVKEDSKWKMTIKPEGRGKIEK